jgi:hypothetical protein
MGAISSASPQKGYFSILLDVSFSCLRLLKIKGSIKKFKSHSFPI